MPCTGNGGYGRLGHKEQKDEFKPKRIETFTQRTPVATEIVRAVHTGPLPSQLPALVALQQSAISLQCLDFDC